MSDGNAAAWVHVGFQAVEVIGGLLGTVGGLAVLLARRTFVTRDELLRTVSEHAKDHQLIDQRLANGENRFTALSGSIDMVRQAAEQARDAALKVEGVHVDIADLRGEMKALGATLEPIQRLTMDMVEGHMADGRNRNGTGGRR